jgi:hypothetical protein
MSKPSLAQYSITELEDYIRARKIIEAMEGKSTGGTTVEKVPKAKAKVVKRRKRSAINPVDVIAAIKKAGADGISGAKLQEAVGTTFNTFTKWFKEHAKVNNIHKDQAKKGPGFVYTIKS